MNRTTAAALFLIIVIVLFAGAFFYSRLRSYQTENPPPDSAPLIPNPSITEPPREEIPDYQILGYTTTSAGTEVFTVDLKDNKRRIVFTDKDESLKVKYIRQATEGAQKVLAYFAKKGEDVAKVLGFIATDGEGKITTLLENFGSSEAPVPSPDGKRIAYIVFSNADPDYGYSLFVMNTDGSNKRRLAKKETLLTQPAFSADGQKLAFIIEGGTGMSIQVVSSDGSAPASTIADFPNETIYDLSWGKEIVFGKRPKSDTGANGGEIYRMDDKGGGRSRVTNNDKYDGSPQLSPDGNYLALTRTMFASGKVSSAGELTLVAIRLSEGEETELGAADGVLGWGEKTPEASPTP